MMLLMNYLDRINVSNARLAGMQKDLGMTDTEWSAGISLFYVGYIISQVPANVVLAKGNPRLLLPICMLGWSVTTICMTALSSGWGFMLCRFVVGVTEGPFVPAVSLMTSSWYTKHESPLRMSIWHAGNIISNVISGLLAAAILTTMEGIRGLHSWQWFVLIEGIVSIAVAIVSFWCIPKWPNNTGTYFLTAEESEMAQYRMQVSGGGYTEDDEGTRWGGVILAAKDPFTWMFACLHFFVIVGQSFKDFFPSILETFHFDKTGTYLLQAPPYLFAYGVCIAVSWSSGRLLEHCWHIVGAMATALAGAVILISTLQQAPRYFGLFLLCSGPFIALNLHLSWETTVVPRPRTKRAALVAIANCASSVTHWFSPYFFLTNQAPRYEMGGGIIIVGCGASILSCLMLKWWVNRKNKQLEERQAQTGEYNEWRFVS
ncbi:major facilitator superfamily domain-containing protein [Microdochium trichocladiopsis]|uniref:Major facilitator superfamily domain-containing protein n=1 Tax=Microdochium trichocladiopsis TaxID=1682393 RepID=A0A9P8YAJ0_9PEZI|nr:major facilitator superfamily domain-containing protein [Microdochium trichocladiopsis]KAH7031695.1 major facilitator superfamily domain-containing protein [Microdochium trichocladiopsis]